MEHTGLKPRHIGYENGVLGGVISALNCVCSRGDNVLVHSPTYIGFTSSLKNNGYEAVHSPLIKDENSIWRMDYADMEKQLREKKIHWQPSPKASANVRTSSCKSSPDMRIFS